MLTLTLTLTLTPTLTPTLTLTLTLTPTRTLTLTRTLALTLTLTRSDLALASGETLRRGDRVSFVHAALNLDADAFSHPTRCDVGAACNLVRPRCNLVRPRCNRCAQV